jgi:hypothetical protein
MNGARKQVRRPPMRGGWQLVELSMVITVLGMISVASTRMVIGLMAIETRAGQSLNDAETLKRLGDAWRTDIHQATRASLAADGNTFTIDLADGRRVTYRINAATLTREEPSPRRRAPARDAFSASARAWRFEKEDASGIVAVVRESAPFTLVGIGAGASPSRTDRIEAAFGVLAWPAGTTSALPGGSP